tara:strand:+ start:489 stop:968 length:480 start_codon:yes stop_codon:yes gene_type:complete
MSQIKKFFSKRISPVWFWAVILVSVYFLFAQKYKIFYLQGSSMSPTHKNGEWSIVQKKHTLKNWRPERFDVVVIRHQEKTTTELITKRIIGLPGETLEIRDGNIYINDKKLKDPFFSKNHDNEDKILIPENYVWVIGDNRQNSLSGLFKIDKIFGILVW